jgi:glucokinase
VRAVGVDLGGTKVAAGIVDVNGHIVERAEAPSDVSSWDALHRCLDDLLVLLDTSTACGIGIGAAGLIDYEQGRYLFGPNLEGLRDLGLRGLLVEAFGKPAFVDNDANCAAWAEHRFGAGRGTRHFICVTLGTGIGGGFVLDGRPYRGAHGGAAEIGHMTVDPHGPPCGCGRRGCWEQLASGQALERLAREALTRTPEGALWELTGGDPARLNGPMVSEAARAGDRLALGVLEELGRWVGVGLASLVNIFEPERIAISGGLVDIWDLIGPAAGDGMSTGMEAPGYRPAPELGPAELGPEAGIVGAALLALDASG